MGFDVGDFECKKTSKLCEDKLVWYSDGRQICERRLMIMTIYEKRLSALHTYKHVSI